jgi:hypothetical protein
LAIDQTTCGTAGEAKGKELMNLEVSKSMQKCISLMRDHGGSIRRYQGGFWRPDPQGGYSFGTSTVEALVKRGLAEYSEWKDGGSGRFPIEATLKPSPASASGEHTS